MTDSSQPAAPGVDERRGAVRRRPAPGGPHSGPAGVPAGPGAAVRNAVARSAAPGGRRLAGHRLLDHRGAAAARDRAGGPDAGRPDRGGPGPGDVRPVRQSAHLSLHRELHPRPRPVRPPRERAHRLRRAVLAFHRGPTDAHPHGLRRDRYLPLGVDERHGHRGDAGPDGDVATRVHGIRGQRSRSATGRRSC